MPATAAAAQQELPSLRLSLDSAGVVRVGSAPGAAGSAELPLSHLPGRVEQLPPVIMVADEEAPEPQTDVRPLAVAVVRP